MNLEEILGVVKITYNDIKEYCLKKGFKDCQNCIYYEDKKHNIDITISDSSFIINNNVIKKLDYFKMYQLIKNLID